MKKRLIYLLSILISTGTILHAQKLKVLEEKKNPDLRQNIKISDTLKSKYLFIDNYYQGRARFHHPDCYWGYLDEEQQEIESERFDWAESFSDAPFSRVDLKRGEAIINLEAKIISPIASYVNWEVRGDYFLLRTYTPDKYALADKNGQLLTTFDLNYIDYINDSLFLLGRGIRQTVFNIHQEQKPSFDFVEIRAEQSTIYFSAAKRRKRYGIVNQKGETIIPFNYKATKTFGDYPVFAVQDPKTELWGFKNAQDEAILDFRYYLADLNLAVVSNNQIAILEDDKLVIYDHAGVELAKYDDYIELFKFSDQVIGIRKGTKCYLLDKEGLIFSDRFDRYSFLGPYCYVNKNNKYGLFDEFGKELITPDYDLVKSLDTDFNYFMAYNWKGASLYNVEKGSFLFEKLDTIISHENSPYLSLVKDGKEQFFDKNKAEIVTDGSGVEQKYYPNLKRYLKKSDQLWYIHDSLGDRLYLRGFEDVQEVRDEYGNKIVALALRLGNNWFIDNGKAALSAPIAYPASRVLNTDVGVYFILEEERNDSIFEGLLRKEDGKLLAEPIYSSIAHIGEDLFVLRDRNNFESIIDTSGRLILRFRDQHDYQLSGDYIISKSIYSYEYNLYRRDGHHLFQEENIKILYVNMMIEVLILEKGEEMAAYNLGQEELIGWDRHYLSFQDGGMIQATKGIHKYWYDKDGNWIECYRKKALPPLRFFD